MPWISKLSLFAMLLVLSVPGLAQTYVFSADSNRARVDSRMLKSRNEMHSVSLQLTVPQIQVDHEKDGFDSLSVPGLVPMDEAGSPELYTTGRLIAVPEGFEAVLTVTKQETQVIEHTTPRPAQRRLRCGSPSEEGFAYNAAQYASGEIFPRNVVALEEAGNFSGIRLVRIAINPIQADLKNHSLTVSTQLAARIDFKRTAVSHPVKVSHLVDQLLHAVPANGMDLDRHFVQSQNEEVLLVVVADQYKSAIQPYVDWKTEKGLKVDVVAYSAAGGSKETVKEYIKNYYTTHDVKPSYLLFVGNKDTLPPYMESTASGSAATDYTYALLAGESNVPNVAYGRLAADNAEDVDLQISRWIAYEKKPMSGAAWYHDGTTIASAEGSNPSDKEYAEQIQAALKKGTYKNVDGFYNSEDTATYANISKAINQGRSWVTYFGHGSGTSWGSTNDTFDNESVSKLENTDKLPVIVDVACQNASWVKRPKCFGKAWVTQTKGKDVTGAVAFLGGSVNVSWHPPAIMAVGVAKYHFEKKIASFGGSVLAGQLYLIEQKGNISSTIDNVKWYNLMGDPSLSIRTEIPN